MELTFEQLPKAVSQLHEKLSNIERILLEKQQEAHPDPERWFDLNELCQYLPDKPAKTTVYGWVHAGTIPHHKGAKRLRFLKSEIDNWLLQGRKRTITETAAEAGNYLKRKR